MSDDERGKGLLHAVVAYGLWGTFPLFWRLLGHVPAMEQFAHRILWSGMFFALLVLLRGEGRQVGDALRRRSTWGPLLAGAFLLGSNWYVYILAVATNRVLEASLGYYLNPLLNVILGAWLLRERLGRAQQVAVVCAACGVGLLTWRQGAVPWIALLLAGLFAGYGFVRKTSGLGALVGSAVESTVLGTAGLLAVVGWEVSGTGGFLAADTGTVLLLLLTGPITALPILGFASAARRLPLSTLGFVQYLSPTLQLVLAVTVLGEPFDATRGVAFGLIWLGVAIFAVGSVRPMRRSAPTD